MKEDTCPVRSKSQVVGEARFNIYDSVAEAVGAIGEEPVLSLVNAQVKTNEMNRIRSEKTGKVSKSQLKNLAMAEITVDEFQAVVGDTTALDALLERKMAEVEARLEAARAANIAAAANEDEDEDED
jgi:hypothetical protein